MINSTPQGSYGHFIRTLKHRDCNQSHIAEYIEGKLQGNRNAVELQAVAAGGAPTPITNLSPADAIVHQKLRYDESSMYAI
jgi:hypothetical protein